MFIVRITAFRITADPGDKVPFQCIATAMPGLLLHLCQVLSTMPRPARQAAPTSACQMLQVHHLVCRCITAGHLGDVPAPGDK
jgi:hypothetical protein